MELIKKILLSILTVVGIALAAVIICLGVMIVFPEVKIFGYSYLNTVSNSTQVETNKAIDSSSSGMEYVFNVETKDFDVQFLPSDMNYVTFSLTNHVAGFTNSMDSNKIASLSQQYDETTHTLSIKVSEPNGWFIQADRLLVIEIPNNIFQNNTISLVTKSNDGKMIFGDKSKDKISFGNITSACTGVQGNVKFANADVTGKLNIKNIFGRVEVKDDLQGDITIDSKIGTYIFANVGNIEVVKGDNVANNPSLTVENCNGNLNYYAQSGYLVVNGTIYGDLEVNSETANVNINTTLKDVFVENQYGSTTINKLGKLSLVSSESSWNIEEDSSDETKKLIDKVMVIKSTDGDIHIGSSIFALSLSSSKGGIQVDNAYKKVTVENAYGTTRITFRDNTLLDTTTDTILNQYINENLIKFAHSTSEMLSITTTNGGLISVKNIKSAINIDAKESQISLDFLDVIGDSSIKTTSKQVEITTFVEDFVLKTQRSKDSKAKYNVDYVSLQLSSYPTAEQVAKSNEKISISTVGNAQYANLYINNAGKDSIDTITIINSTGAIIAKSKV